MGFPSRLTWLSFLTAKEYAELRFFSRMEMMPDQKLCMSFGMHPRDLEWTPEEQHEDDIIRTIESM